MSQKLIKHQSFQYVSNPKEHQACLSLVRSLWSLRIPFIPQTFASLHLQFSTFNVDWNKSLLNCSETQRKELEAEQVIDAKPEWSLVSLF